jgi:hypothetical protein
VSFVLRDGIFCDGGGQSDTTDIVAINIFLGGNVTITEKRSFLMIFMT